MRTELAARGFDYESSSRLTGWINRAYNDLCEEEDWPFLEATTSGTAPVSVSTLRTIESVIDTTTMTKLTPIDRRNITDFNYDLATTGSPTYYYTTGTTTVAVYPANTTDTISIRYWKFPTELSLDADEPLVPARFQQVIIDGACFYAYMDSPNVPAAQAWASVFEVGKARMREALLTQQHDQPDDYIVSVVDHQDA